MNNELKTIIESGTETKKWIIDLFLSVDEEGKDLILKTIHLLAEDPKRLDFAKNWKGTAEELRLAVAQI